jgi:hypothetical protein
VQNVVDRPIHLASGSGFWRSNLSYGVHLPTRERPEEHPHAVKEATVQRLLCSESIPGTGDRQPAEIRTINKPLDNPDFRGNCTCFS